MMDMEDGARTRNIAVAATALAVLALVLGWFLFIRDNDPRVVHLENSAGSWLVLERSGGFAGVSDHMTLSSEGEAVVRDEAAGTVRRLRLSPKRMDAIHAALEDVAWDELPTFPDRQMICADCYTYEIEHDGNFATGSLITRDERSIQPLLTELFTVLDRARQAAG